MKIHVYTGLWMALVAVWPWSVCVAEPYELVERVPNGYVDWTNGALIVTGAAVSRTDDSSAMVFDRNDVLRRARSQAAMNMLDSLSHIKMDSHTSVADHIAANGDIRSKLKEMAEAAPYDVRRETLEGVIDLGVRMSLYGGFSQLTLPMEIKQVDPIKAVHGVTDQNGGVPSAPEETFSGAMGATAFTGLVVDARGVAVQPAFLPTLTDEDGQALYGPAFISREFAVQRGVCAYVRRLGSHVESRVGAKPLVAKGLRTLTGRPCDIVISNVDAAKIRSASTHLQFLRQCRVVIVTD